MNSIKCVIKYAIDIPTTEQNKTEYPFPHLHALLDF